MTTVAASHGILHIEQLQEGCPNLKVLRITNSQITLSPPPTVAPTPHLIGSEVVYLCSVSFFFVTQSNCVFALNWPRAIEFAYLIWHHLNCIAWTGGATTWLPRTGRIICRITGRWVPINERRVLVAYLVGQLQIEATRYSWLCTANTPNIDSATNMGIEAFILVGMQHHTRHRVNTISSPSPSCHASVVYNFDFSNHHYYHRSGLELIAEKWASSLIEFDLAWANVQEPLDNALKVIAETGRQSPMM